MATLERIAALLAKAERTDNPIEADAYLAKAQELATTASIDLAVARARSAARERRAEPEMRTVTIGEVGKRANQHLIALFVAVAHANDAHVDVASNSTFVLAYGMPTDLDVIEALYASLSVQMVQQSQEWLSTGAWRGTTYTRVERDGWRTKRVTRPHTAQTARAAFSRGFVARIAERLEEARERARSTSFTAADTGASTEIALRDKAREVRAFHRSASRASGSWRGYGGAARGDRGRATAAGRDAAQRARLRDDPGLAGPRGALPS